MKQKGIESRSYIKSFYAKNRLNFALSLVMIFLNAGANLLLSYLVGKILDAMTSGSLNDLQCLILPVVTGILVGLGSNLLLYYYKSRFIHRGIFQYKDTIFSALSSKNISAFTKENTSRYLSILTNDTGTIEESYLNHTLLLVYNCIILGGSLCLMTYLSWELTLMTIVISCLPIVSTVFFGNKLTSQERKVSDQNERFVAQIKDYLSGFSTIKGFKAEAQAKASFSHANRTVETIKEKRRWISGILSAISEFSGFVMQFSVFLVGTYLTIVHRSSAGAMLSIVSLSNYVFQPIEVIPQYWAGRKASKGLIEKAIQISEENSDTTGKLLSSKLACGVIFDHASFGYQEGNTVLSNISIRFDLGKTYAIVGSSGSGKSTLLHLLMGGYRNYCGSISINGMELREIATDSLYNTISVIDQNVFLFDASIKENITMFQDFPAEQLKDAIQKSGLVSLVEHKGLDYKCGENGQNLSGGERQRISIARCILRGTPILMMDEATAALDKKTAFEVTSSILQLPELTRIVVTHRLDRLLLQKFDQIIVLNNGEIVEQGPFDDLMNHKGYFYSLYTINNA